jgi:DNA (cytosine-5)-methyltransferase 1
MRVVSLFSGVGGFDMGLEAAGMTTVFQCEIDKHARAVLDYHWPDVPKWDDVSTLTGAHILEATGGVDVVAWGSPCQDLSLAGKRAGLSGERSGLFHQGIRIIKELRELSNGTYPTWSIWENVVGALSSNGGADFGEVLHEMDEAGACFSEWVVLDAQYFGVPQRRRRVFVISCFDPATAAGCPDKIFAVGESRSGDSAKGKPSRQDTSGTSTTSFGNSGFQRWSEQDHAVTLSARDHKSSNTVVVEEQPIMFSHTQGMDAQPSEVHSPTLRREGNGAAVAYTVRNREGKPGGGKGPLVSEDTSLTLARANDQVLFVEPVANTLRVGSGVGERGDGSDNLIVEPFTAGSIGGYVDGVGTLRASGGDLGGGSETLLVHSQPETTKVSGTNT